MASSSEADNVVSMWTRARESDRVRRAATYLGEESVEGWQLGHSIVHQVSHSVLKDGGAIK